MASPTRLMRRSIRNTPIGPAPSASANVPASAAAHELELGERGDEEVVHGNHDATDLMPQSAAPRIRAACSSNASHMRRAVSRFSAVSTVAVRPQATGSRASSSVSGKFASHEIDVVQRREHGALLAVPAPHQVEQVGRGLGVDRVERLVEHDHARILQQQPREQHALHLAARQRRRSARSSKPVSPTAAIACSIVVARLAVDAAEQAGAAPQPHRHHVVDVDREACGRSRRPAADRRCPARCSPPRSMRPASGLITPTMPLNSVDLPAPFGPTTAISAPVVDRAVEMMHRRMAVVAEREIAELQRRASCASSAHVIAQNTAPHSTAISTAADREPLQRRHAQDRRRDRRRRMAAGRDGGDGDGGRA